MAQIREEICDSLLSCRFFPKKQKVWHKWIWGIGELLYINQHILKESKTKWKSIAIAWIDYQKTCMVPQNWIIKILKMYQISGEVIKSIENTMENWRLKLTAEGKSLTEVKIQRGIFQGDALSPLLFIIVMMPLNHILWKCTDRYKLHKSQEKIMDDIKLFAKNEKKMETLI